MSKESLSIADTRFVEPPAPNVFSDPTAKAELFSAGHYEKLGREVVARLPNYKQKYKSLMVTDQTEFVLGLLAHYRFPNGDRIKQVVEIGVYNGVNSLYMLKTGCSAAADFQLYGIDLGDTDFFGGAAIAESTPDELAHYHLHRACTALDVEKVLGEHNAGGGGVDLLFVDAGHSHPFPLIDLVCLLPFLRRDAIVLLHDVVDYMRPNAWGESFIYVGWTANKYRAKYLDGNNQIVGESSLGVIEIPEKPAVLHQNLLTLAGLPWRATPWQNSPVFPLDENDLIRLRELLLKHYAPDFANELVDKLAAQLAVYNQWALLSWHETRFFNWLFEQECATATRNGFSRNGFYRSQIRRSLFSVKIRRDWWNVSFLGLQVGSRVFADRPAWLRVKIGK